LKEVQGKALLSIQAAIIISCQLPIISFTEAKKQKHNCFVATAVCTVLATFLTRQ